MPFKEHPDTKVRFESAVLAAKAILQLDLYPPHKRDLLKICIWKITEANGKYKTRFRTRASQLVECSKTLAHEHVFRMKFLIDDLIYAPSNADSILERAVGCTVTRSEHEKLSALDRRLSDIDGWARYREAMIEVIDTATGKVHPLRGTKPL